MNDTFRRATLDEYVSWLRLWLQWENEPTHYYDYPFERWNNNWLYAQKNFTTGGECGALSAHIIVPNGVRHIGGDLGHNDLYLADGTTGNRCPCVPVFNNPEFMKIRSVRKFIARKEEEEAKFWAEAKRERRMSALRAAGSDIGKYLGRGYDLDGPQVWCAEHGPTCEHGCIR
jgi:hypothetical protein